jgi:hypothetical protein
MPIFVGYKDGNMAVVHSNVFKTGIIRKSHVRLKRSYDVSCCACGSTIRSGDKCIHEWRYLCRSCSIIFFQSSLKELEDFSEFAKRQMSKLM